MTDQLLSPAETEPSSNRSRIEGMRAFISSEGFPCVGAKSALNKKRIQFIELRTLGDPSQTPELFDALIAYSAAFPDPGVVPVSFVALFDGSPTNEIEFEKALWTQLQSLHDLDRERGYQWNCEVSHDSERCDFSFSVGGRAFFVVGMHPQASRHARRSAVPCLVFNFHDQFEAMKASGKYQSMQEAIRQRDIDLQGSINPVLARFGEASEARQYSGRAVESNWKCPFHHHS
ncbi:guanitoxin biosynthesis heme-dependent pre-guanitoxin N-hydroxylase GntA [Variovorax sp. DAIF25]|jgi:uncharacterized protein|uniref:guanitoxin biosynthesis heme-dependent pre-guanitoxin N-hydroxylase GntA n=1 Tax=Variovorax sp. DAIF25 TaxID=3080983 RepID=UPI003D6C4224